MVQGTHKYDGYVDMATIGPTGKTVTFWTLKDFVDRQIPQGTYRSVKIKKQIDCEAGKSRPLQTKYYAGQMGGWPPHAGGQGDAGNGRESRRGDGEAEFRWSARRCSASRRAYRRGLESCPVAV